MLHPAPTTKLDPTLARGTILEVLDADDRHPARVVMGFPNTDYRIELIIKGDVEPVRALKGEMVLARLFADARRIDTPDAGGRRFEPCIGRPTRILGTVIGVDPASNVLVVNAGQPIALRVTAPGQEAQALAHAAFIVCDVKPGAWFVLERAY
ncbi:MAG: hypothetical protein ACF8MF_02120 [Phycisphaerales bacterium JB052]